MNRKQRRAQQATPSSTNRPTITNADQIPLRVPNRDSQANIPKTKTLYEIAAEKQAELLSPSTLGNGTTRMPTRPDASNLVTVKVGPDGTIVQDSADGTTRPFRVEDLNKPHTSTDGDEGEAAIPPIIDTMMLASSLGAVNFTLEVLAAHQYAEEVDWRAIAKRTGLTAVPILFLLIHLVHGHLLGSVAWLSSRTKYLLVQGGFVAVANVAGCYLIQLTNEHGYYAVMKKAPSIGTVWIWSIIELGLAGALAGVVGPALYAWWFGYGVF